MHRACLERLTLGASPPGYKYSFRALRCDCGLTSSSSSSSFFSIRSDMRPLLFLSSVLSTGDPRVRLSALVVFSVASLDLLRELGSSTASSYFALLDLVLLVSENSVSSGSDDRTSPIDHQPTRAPERRGTHEIFSYRQARVSCRFRLQLCVLNRHH